MQLLLEISPAAQPDAVDGSAVEAAAPPPEAARNRRLPELYYLHNFRRALDSLGERYGNLLSAAERGFIEQFNWLDKASQCLLTRLLMRKGPVFRRATLAYPEVADLQSALGALANRGWIDTDPAFTIDELAEVLTRSEWRETFRTPVRSAVPGDAVLQLALPILHETALPRPLSQWHPRLEHSHVRLDIEPLVRQLQFLYFGNDYQSWAEFVLTDLGLQRHEAVPYSADSCAFRSREEIEHFYRLNECRARARDGEAPAALLAISHPPDGVADWLAARFTRLQLQLGELLRRQGEHDLALQAYRATGTADGYIRSIRLQERLGLHAHARDEALRAAQLECSETERLAIARALKRLRRRLGESVAPSPPRHRPQVLELEMPRLIDRQRVEHQVGAAFSSPECPAFYVENSLFPSLFGLLCWDAIFAPLRGAFFHPFQSGPADLYTREFRERRTDLLGTRLAALASGEYREIIRRNYRRKAGTFNAFVRWGRLKPQVLELALACIAPRHLQVIFDRLLDDLENHCSGLPDLVHFRPGEQTYQLVEVKAPGDRLQDNQRRWMEFFAAQGIPAVVCQVRWAGSAVPPLRVQPRDCRGSPAELSGDA